MGLAIHQGLGESVQGNLLEHLIREIEAMLEWGLTNGMDIPGELAERFYTILNELHSSNELASENQDATPLALHSDDIGDLVAIHSSLGAIIHPAKPRTVALMYYQRRNSRISNILGPIPIIRQLVIMALLFVTVMYGMSFFSDVNINNINKSILDDESFGLEQLKNQAFLLACAGLGSVFSCLFLAMHYVTQGTYDPKYNASYWVRMILGLMAGLIMVELIPDSLFATAMPDISAGGAMGTGEGDRATSATGEGSFMSEFGKPTMALLGGFSATIVHRLLQKLVDILGAIIDQLPGDGVKRTPQNIEPGVGEQSEFSPWESRRLAKEAAQQTASKVDPIEPVMPSPLPMPFESATQDSVDDEILPPPPVAVKDSASKIENTNSTGSTRKISLRKNR